MTIYAKHLRHVCSLYAVKYVDKNRMTGIFEVPEPNGR